MASRPRMTDTSPIAYSDPVMRRMTVRVTPAPRAALRGLLGLASTLFALGCSRSAPSVESRASASRTSAAPQVTDDYVRLLRKQLTAADPYVVQKEINCEADRLMDQLGELEALRRMESARDTAFTHSERRVRDRIHESFANRVFYANDGCEALWRARDSTGRDPTR